MAIREIVIFPDDRLRRPTKTVTIFDEKLKTLVADMFDTMYDDDGIGLAAPQIGISKKVVVLDVSPRDEEGNVIEDLKKVFINPVIVEKRGEIDSDEGCLSLPNFYDTVKRAEWIKVEAQDLDGQKFTIEADGMLAICLQHEIDHLNGIVFSDYLCTFKRDEAVSKMRKYKKTLEEEKAKEQAAEHPLANKPFSTKGKGKGKSKSKSKGRR